LSAIKDALSREDAQEIRAFLAKGAECKEAADKAAEERKNERC